MSIGGRRDEPIPPTTTTAAAHFGPITPGILLDQAIAYADNGWAVFPLRGKVPAIASPHPKGTRCMGECGLHGHGVYDATTDIATICRWWAVDYIGANIGARVPDPLFVLDSDPKTEGHVAAASRLLKDYGHMPHTLTTISGRLDGGCHRFYRRPAGKLSTKLLGPGFDIKDSSGYVVVPPSIHPATRKSYIAVDAEIVDPPAWLTKLIVVPPPPPRRERTASEKFFAGTRYRATPGGSPAEMFNANSSWSEILPPHGWTCLDADPDGDGARWLHPTATSQCSATIRNDCLFVYSTSTEFEPTTSGEPNGYTKFRAHALLNFNGDMSSAARSLRKVL